MAASDILKGIEFSFNVLIETCERKQINSVMQTSKKVILSLTSQVTAELVIKFHLAIDKNAKNKTPLHCTAYKRIKFFHKWVKAQGYMWSSQRGQILSKGAFYNTVGRK